MTEQKLYPWTEGQSTQPEIDALMRAYPPESIVPGVFSVTDSDVSEIIGNQLDSARYNRIHLRWRKRLKKEHGKVVWRVDTIGFRAPTAAEVYSATHPRLASAGRIVSDQLLEVSVSPPTNQIEGATQEHLNKLLYVQRRELKKARMNLLPPTAAPLTPTIKPPVLGVDVATKDDHRSILERGKTK